MNIRKDHSRIGFIDIFRGIGIVLMIMGHIRFGSFFDKWIHAFHMPMYFFISGWFYRKTDRTLLQIAGKKARSLIVPYVFFYFIQLLICLLFIPAYRNWNMPLLLLSDNTSKVPVGEQLFDISPIPGALWFLTAVFFTEVIYAALTKAIKDRKALHAAVVCISIFGMLLPLWVPSGMYLGIDIACVGIGFFHLATCMKGDKTKKLLELKPGQTIIAFCIVFLLIFLNRKVNMRTRQYEYYPLFWLNAVSSIIVGWNVSRYIECLLKKNKILLTVSERLKCVGKNSIVYLCTNQIVILITMMLISALGFNGVMSKVIVLFATMIVLFGIEKLMCGTKLKIFLGKK